MEKLKLKSVIKIKYHSKKCTLFQTYLTPLLGRTWIRNLNINLQEIDKESEVNINNYQINASDNIEDIINQFPEVFEQKIGKVPEFIVSLRLRENAKPVFHKEKEVSYALREKVEKELNYLKTAGIISKVNLSDWGSPLVAIPKNDGGIRL